MLSGESEETAHIALSPVGEMIQQIWCDIPNRHPEIDVCDYQIMPDHIHGIIHVKHELKRHLGEYIRGFKIGATQAYRDITIPTEEGNLVFSAMGNMFLLNRPHKQTIICSRSITEDQYRAYMRDVIEKAESGYVSISGCISKGEQQICRTIRETGLPLIVLMKDGFPSEEDPHSKFFKPQGIYFEACARGQLLMMEPTKDIFLLPSISDAVYRKAPIAPPDSDRYRFLAINEMAKKIETHQ